MAAECTRARSHSTQTTYTLGGKHLTKVVGSGTNCCIVKYQCGPRDYGTPLRPIVSTFDMVGPGCGWDIKGNLITKAK